MSTGESHRDAKRTLDELEYLAPNCNHRVRWIRRRFVHELRLLLKQLREQLNEAERDFWDEVTAAEQRAAAKPQPRSRAKRVVGSSGPTDSGSAASSG